MASTSRRIEKAARGVGLDDDDDIFADTAPTPPPKPLVLRELERDHLEREIEHQRDHVSASVERRGPWATRIRSILSHGLFGSSPSSARTRPVEAAPRHRRALSIPAQNNASSEPRPVGMMRRFTRALSLPFLSFADHGSDRPSQLDVLECDDADSVHLRDSGYTDSDNADSSVATRSPSPTVELDQHLRQRPDEDELLAVALHDAELPAAQLPAVVHHRDNLDERPIDAEADGDVALPALAKYLFMEAFASATLVVNGAANCIGGAWLAARHQSEAMAFFEALRSHVFTSTAQLQALRAQAKMASMQQIWHGFVIQAHERRVGELSSQLEVARRENGRLTTGAAALATHVGRYQKKVLQYKQKEVTLDAELRVARREHGRLEIGAAALAIHVGRYQKKVAHYKKVELALGAELNCSKKALVAAQRELAEASDRASSAEDRANSLEGELEQERSSSAELRLERDRERDSNAELRRELELERREKAEAHAALALSEEAEGDLRAEADHLREALARSEDAGVSTRRESEVQRDELRALVDVAQRDLATVERDHHAERDRFQAELVARDRLAQVRTREFEALADESQRMRVALESAHRDAEASQTRHEAEMVALRAAHETMLSDVCRQQEEAAAALAAERERRVSSAAAGIREITSVGASALASVSREPSSGDNGSSSNQDVGSPPPASSTEVPAASRFMAAAPRLAADVASNERDTMAAPSSTSTSGQLVSRTATTRATSSSSHGTSTTTANTASSDRKEREPSRSVADNAAHRRPAPIDVVASPKSILDTPEKSSPPSEAAHKRRTPTDRDLGGAADARRRRRREASAAAAAAVAAARRILIQEAHRDDRPLPPTSRRRTAARSCGRAPKEDVSKFNSRRFAHQSNSRAWRFKRSSALSHR